MFFATSSGPGYGYVNLPRAVKSKVRVLDYPRFCTVAMIKHFGKSREIQQE